MTNKKPSADYCPNSQAGRNHGPTDKHERCTWCGYRYWAYTELNEYNDRLLRSSYCGPDDYSMWWDPDYDGSFSNSGTKRGYRNGD